MPFRDLPDRLAEVRARIDDAVSRGGHGQPVTIVAVTKTYGPEAPKAAWDAGLREVGENKVQEALAKIPMVDAPLRWHLIGHLQRNKAKHVAGRFALVHSVDSVALADELDRRAAGGGQGVKQRVLLQVNVAGETQKSGCAPGEAQALARHAAALPHLSLEGLMTIAPFTDDEGVQRRTFRELRALRDTLQEEGLWLPTLSMGMSADYGVAVEEGATVIRLGTVLFGLRAMGGERREEEVGT